MNNAIIVQFAINTTGEHCLVTKKAFDDLSAETQTTKFQALVKIVGEGRIVGLLVKTHRNEKSTKTLSTETNVSDATINRIENGTKKLTCEILKKLSIALPDLEKDLIAVGILITD